MHFFGNGCLSPKVPFLPLRVPFKFPEHISDLPFIHFDENIDHFLDLNLLNGSQRAPVFFGSSLLVPESPEGYLWVEPGLLCEDFDGFREPGVPPVFALGLPSMEIGGQKGFFKGRR